jgi:hypothetical protein
MADTKILAIKLQAVPPFIPEHAVFIIQCVTAFKNGLAGSEAKPIENLSEEIDVEEPGSSHTDRPIKQEEDHDEIICQWVPGYTSTQATPSSFSRIINERVNKPSFGPALPFIRPLNHSGTTVSKPSSDSTSAIEPNFDSNAVSKTLPSFRSGSAFAKSSASRETALGQDLDSLSAHLPTANESVPRQSAPVQHATGPQGLISADNTARTFGYNISNTTNSFGKTTAPAHQSSNVSNTAAGFGLAVDPVNQSDNITAPSTRAASPDTAIGEFNMGAYDEDEEEGDDPEENFPVPDSCKSTMLSICLDWLSRASLRGFRSSP